MNSFTVSKIKKNELPRIIYIHMHRQLAWGSNVTKPSRTYIPFENELSLNRKEVNFMKS